MITVDEECIKIPLTSDFAEPVYNLMRTISAGLVTNAWAFGNKSLEEVVDDLGKEYLTVRHYEFEGEDITVTAVPVMNSWCVESSCPKFRAQVMPGVRAEDTPGSCFRQLDFLYECYLDRLSKKL